MQLPKLNLRKIKGFLYQYRISATIILVSTLVAIGAIVYGLNNKVQFSPSPLSLQEKKETRVAAPLTGELVDPSIVSRRPVAVVIENHTDARPQSGYNDADLVYETLAEGGITRTLAIFQSKDAKEIGPVRSAREYFVDWATELDAIFAHVGGSVDALDLISQLGTPDINQFYNANSFWRANDRYAPHNVYTTTEKIWAAAKANNQNITTTVKSLLFKDDLVAKDRVAGQKVNIDFSGPDYMVNYEYDVTTNSYMRSVAGVQSKDRNTGTRISPKNVLALYTSVVPFVNREGAQGVRIGLIGKGSGFLFQDGKTTPISWSKSSRDAQTKYVDAEGNEIKLNKGQTWIEVVPEGQDVTY